MCSESRPSPTHCSLGAGGDLAGGGLGQRPAPWRAHLWRAHRNAIGQASTPLVWNAGGDRLGRSFGLWETPVTKFCKWLNIGEWKFAAQDKALWLQYTEHFFNFMHM